MAVKNRSEIDIVKLGKLITTAVFLEAAMDLSLDVTSAEDRQTIETISKLTAEALNKAITFKGRFIFGFISMFPEIIKLLRWLGIPIYKLIAPLGNEIGEMVLRLWKSKAKNQHFVAEIPKA